MAKTKRVKKKVIRPKLPITRWQTLLIHLNGLRRDLHNFATEELCDTPVRWMDPLPLEIRVGLLPYINDMTTTLQALVNEACGAMLEEHPDAEIPPTIYLEITDSA